MHTTTLTSTSPEKTAGVTEKRAPLRCWSPPTIASFCNASLSTTQLSVHHLLAEVYDGVDWVLVEGFKTSDLLKVEVWRKASEQPVRYPDDDFVVAIATDSPQDLPEPTQRPVLDLNDPYAITDWLVTNENRFEYNPLSV